LNAKKLSPQLRLELIVVLLVSLAGCEARKDNGVTPLTPHISLKQVYDLGANPTWDDVVKLVGGVHPTSDLILDCPAEEGGVYFFLFWPTNEIPGEFPTERQPLLTWPLTAVLKAKSINAYFDGEVIYVWPKRLSGKRCTGHGGRSWKPESRGSFEFPNSGPGS
jgi:hypothetical protein